MIRSNLYDASDVYIHVKATIIVLNPAAASAPVDNTNKKAIFKNRSPFTNCLSEINNTQMDNGQEIDVVMPMYNVIEYTDGYSKISGNL